MNDYRLYDDLEAIERYLNVPPGSLASIPIYARVPAINAIIKVKEMEKKSLFRPGLYYIVLTDLIGHTAFNRKYGDEEGNIRIQWFHTCVIQSLGEIEVSNYVAFGKTIGDAVLLIFSAFVDIYNWSERLTKALASMTDEYPESLDQRDIDFSDGELEQRMADFAMRARRLIHLGEVSFAPDHDPLSLAVAQTFKIEKIFGEEALGCTQPAADAITPKLKNLGLRLFPNKPVSLEGIEGELMTYYLRETVEK